MAIRSRQIGWSNKSNLLYDVLRELNALKGQFASSTNTTTTSTTTIDPNNLTLKINNSTNFDISAGEDYTIEWFAKMSVDDNHPRPWSIGSWPSAAHAVSIENGYFYYWINGSIVANKSIPNNYLNLWTHFCIMRKAGDVYLYVNGNVFSIEALSVEIPTNGYDLYLGSEGNDSIQNGLMSNFRWTNAAVYNTSGFIPPTSELSVLTNTKLLIFQGDSIFKEITDNSGNGYTITNSTGKYYPENPFIDQGSIIFGTLPTNVLKFTIDNTNGIFDSNSLLFISINGTQNITLYSSVFNDSQIVTSLYVLSAASFGTLANQLYDFYITFEDISQVNSIQVFPGFNLSDWDLSNLQYSSILLISANSMSLSSTSINNALAACVAANQSSPYGSFSTILQTPAAPPTGQGIDDVTTLLNRGWTVTTD